MDLNEVLGLANEFRHKALSMNMEFRPNLEKQEVLKYLELDTKQLVSLHKEGKVDDAIEQLKLKQCILYLQNLFYDFSEYIETEDLLPFLEQEHYDYIVEKSEELDTDLSTTMQISNIIFCAILRHVIRDKSNWNLMLYRIKCNWQNKNRKQLS